VATLVAPGGLRTGSSSSEMAILDWGTVHPLCRKHSDGNYSVIPGRFIQCVITRCNAFLCVTAQQVAYIIMIASHGKEECLYGRDQRWATGRSERRPLPRRPIAETMTIHETMRNNAALAGRGTVASDGSRLREVIRKARTLGVAILVAPGGLRTGSSRSWTRGGRERQAIAYATV
jgi:hypothetical protein